MHAVLVAGVVAVVLNLVLPLEDPVASVEGDVDANMGAHPPPTLAWSKYNFRLERHAGMHL